METGSELSLESVHVKRSWLDDDDLQAEEKEFLHLVSEGDLVKLQYLMETHEQRINVDCCDCRGYRALDIAVSQHDEELVIGLLSMCEFSKTHLQGALLRSVEVSDLRLVALLLEKCKGSEQKLFRYKNQQCVDLTPIMLAAINEDFEIIMFLLNKGYRVVKPHLPKCNCTECIAAEFKSPETLKESISRMNAYRALASPTYIVLSSPDPVLTAFKLSSEAKCLADEVPEHKEMYKQIAEQCSQFSADFLQQCQNTEEVEILLSQRRGLRDLRHHRYSRIWLAVRYDQKRFVAHPHCQQVLYSTWLEGFTVWKAFSTSRKVLHILTQSILTPVICVTHVLLPRTKIIKPLKVPFNRFIYGVTSYVFFLCLLLASLFSDNRQDIRQPSNWPRLVADVWIVGNVLEAVVRMWSMGIFEYLRTWWAKYDFIMSLAFLLSESICFGVYLYSYYNSGDIMWKRMELPWWHPVLIGEGVFACACVLAFCRVLLWYQMQSRLGPLGTSLTEMVNDVLRFFSIFFVLMFSFGIGINSLYRNYKGTVQYIGEGDQREQNEAFVSVRKTFKTLFWATFGMGEPDYADIIVAGNFTNAKIIEHRFTENVGYIMWGFYHLLTVIIMLNMLIAMMAQSYDRVQGNADVEWKFARSTVWLSYFDSDTIIPSPFNLLPSLRRIAFLGEWTLKRFAKKSFPSSPANDVYLRAVCCRVEGMDHVDSKDSEERYQRLLTLLRRRYLDWRNKGQAAALYPAPNNPYELRESLKQEVKRMLSKRVSQQSK